MKDKKTTKKSKKIKYASETTSMLVEAMKLVSKAVKEENKRWGLPLLVWENGKITEIPPSKF